MIAKHSSPRQPRPGTASLAETVIPTPDPPECFARSQFRVGKAVTTAPFVIPSQLRTHLGLLRAFDELKVKVQGDSNIVNALPPLAKALDPEARWVWFLELALERCAFRRFSHFTFQNEPGIGFPDFKDGFRLLACCVRHRPPWIIHP